jgi:hypothetical protein
LKNYHARSLGLSRSRAAVLEAEVKRRGVAVSEVKRLQIYNGHVQRPFPNGHRRPFGRAVTVGCVAAVAVGQRQRLCSGVRMFTGFHLSSMKKNKAFCKWVEACSMSLT